MSETVAGHIPSAGHHEEKSIWPIVAGPGIALMGFGFLITLSSRPIGLPILVVGVVVALFGLIGWWREVISLAPQEPVTTHPSTRDPLGVAELYEDLSAHVGEQARNLRLGFVLFIASEVMFFAAFFGFYFYSRGHIQVWPPVGYPTLENSWIPPLNTALLLTSGLTFTWGHHGLIHNRRDQLKLGLALTILLGATFLSLQAWEWTHLGLSIRDGLLGTAFFLLTGFHGAHVILGVIFLTVMLGRASAGHFTPSRHFALQACGWYWHFVDVVWILLFSLLYMWT